MKTALISIHPKYAQLILSGEKTIELRKRWNGSIDRILIYETSPTKMIVGEATVCLTNLICYPHDYQLDDDELRQSCVTQDEFVEYVGKSELAYLIHLEKVIKYETPRPLPAGVKPPQSWCFWKEEWL